MRLIVILATACLGACNSPNSRVTELDFATSKVLASTGNLRLVTERPRYQDASYPEGARPPLPIVCTEPSPDYAIAFGTNASGNAKVDIAGSGSGEGGATFATSENATAMAGRTAGVLALRDGLYAACQSYVNGVIGHDAYAMILSQYGTLLVALVGGSGASGGNATVTGGAGAITVNANGTAQPKTSAASETAATGRQAAQAALLVACVSAYDETRNPRSTNRLLSPVFCRGVLATAARGAARG